MEGWDLLLRNEDYASSSSDEENEQENEGSRNGEKYESDKEVDKVFESSCMQVDDLFYDNDNNKSKERMRIEIPLRFYSKKTSVNEVHEKEMEAPSEEVNQNLYNSVRNNSLNASYCSQRFKAGGSIIDLMDELVKVGQTMGCNMDGCVKNIETIIGSQGDHKLLNEFNIQGLGHKTKKGWIKELCTKNRVNLVFLQETKMEHIELVTINKLWGNSSYNYAFSSSLGNSGGILCVWEPTLFLKENITSSDYFLAVTSTWIPTSSKLLIISFYAPQDLTEKRMLWDYLLRLINRWDGECVIMGGFNEVRSEHERRGSVFNVQSAVAFDNFIPLASLIDLPLDGYTYIWVHKSATKMSKLDRILISKGLMASFPHLSSICLDKHLPDRRPILMRERNIDYGPTPSNEVLLNDRSILIKELHDIISMDFEEMAQKAKVCWAIEGDENSKYFHVILNNKRSHLAIRGVLVNGDWIVKPNYVKNEFLNHFSSQFDRPVSHRICLADVFSNQLSLEQQDDLEQTVSIEEIKRASAFISNWKILDDPFILNELLSWCKYRKLKAMVFKVDFEKAFDSIRAHGNITRLSPWLDIVREINVLRSKGINFLSFIRKKVGNGEDTLFWEDSWFDGISLKQQFPRLYSLESAKHINVAEKMNHLSLSWSYRREPRGGSEEEQQNMLFSRISGVILLKMRDRWIWSFEAS
nr:RNA-directed DNA polymerase, eukaryota [Tanacetum cinerariifolium]